MKNKEKKMQKLFSLDGRLVKTLTRLIDIIILNTLFIVCCLPILTIGASLTALATMWHRLLKGEDTDLVFHFFRLFRANFKQATVIWWLPPSPLKGSAWIDICSSCFLPLSYFSSFLIRTAGCSHPACLFSLFCYLASSVRPGFCRQA